MKMVVSLIAVLMLTWAAPAKKAEGREKKPAAPRTINTFRTDKGTNISFTCSPANCREQQDGSLSFNLSCQTNKDGDKLEVYVGDTSQTIQAYGFVDIPFELVAPKKGSVPIKIFASETEGSPKTMFTFKYTVEQVKRPTCHKFGDVEL